MKKKQSLLISPIGKATSSTRNRAIFVEELVKSAFKDIPGYEDSIERADVIASYGDEILIKIINETAKCDLVIADTSGNNPNVMFELGIALILEKPILLLRTQEELNHKPTDIAHYQFIAIPNHMAAYNEDYKKFEADKENAKKDIAKEALSVIDKYEKSGVGLLGGKAAEMVKKLSDKSGLLENVRNLNKEIEILQEENRQLENEITRRNAFIEADLESKIKSCMNQLENSEYSNITSKFINYCYSLGQEFERDTKNLALTLQFYQTLFPFDTRNPAIHYRLGSVHYASWKVEEKLEINEDIRLAQEYCEHALQLKSDFPEAMELLNEINKQINKLKKDKNEREF